MHAGAGGKGRRLRWVAAVAAAWAVAAGSSAAAFQPTAVYVAGNNQDNQLAISPAPELIETFTLDPALSGAETIAAGDRFILAVEPNGELFASGANETDQLGLGEEGEPKSPTSGYVVGVEKKTERLDEVTAVAAGRYFAIALLKSGKVVAWGREEEGVLGNGVASTSLVSAPVYVKGVGGKGVLEDVKAIAAGERFALALLEDGEVVSWGAPAFGELGDDHTLVAQTVPQKVVEPGGKFPLTEVAAIAAGQDAGFAVLKDGRMVAWGRDEEGQLGVGEAVTSGCHCLARPAYVKGVEGRTNYLEGVKAVTAGGEFALGLLEDGKVARLGTVTSTEPSFDSPVLVAGEGGSGELEGVVEAAAGGSFALVRTEQGNLLGWGENGFDELGTGKPVVAVPFPTEIPLHVVTRLFGAPLSLDSLVQLGSLLTVFPTSLEFGAGTVGQQLTLSLELTNPSGAPIQITEILPEPTKGSGAPTPAPTTGSCTVGGELPPNGSCTLPFTFTSPVVGTAEGRLRILSTASNSPQTVTYKATWLAPVTVRTETASTTSATTSQTVTSSSTTTTTTSTTTTPTPPPRERPRSAPKGRRHRPHLGALKLHPPRILLKSPTEQPPPVRISFTASGTARATIVVYRLSRGSRLQGRCVARAANRRRRRAAACQVRQPIARVTTTTHRGANTVVAHLRTAATSRYLVSVVAVAGRVRSNTVSAPLTVKVMQPKLDGDGDRDGDDSDGDYDND